MKPYVLVILLLVNFKALSQRNYDVIIRDDSTYWDSENSYLKTKDIVIPKSNLQEVEIKITPDIRRIIDQEISYNLEKLKNLYPDFPNNPKIKEDRINYRSNEGLTIIHSTITVDYEHTEIAVLILVDKNKKFAYSESNKLGEKIKLFALVNEGDKYILYGNLQGNPETYYGGDFRLIFDKNKRILEYSYYENGG